MTNSQSVEALFKPFEMGNLKLSNRIILAPMTRNFSPNGVPGEDVAAYYRRRAENGVGLILTEGTFINHPDVASEVPAWQEDVPHLYGEEALNGWSKVVDGVHEAGGKIFSQMWHMGARGNVNDYSKQEISELVEAFVQAAVNAKKVGFDGIEIMAAHGFLIDQFFWEKQIRVTMNTVATLSNVHALLVRLSQLADVLLDQNFQSCCESHNGNMMPIQQN